MADDSNIDDILKSIDALLKEGEGHDEQRRHQDGANKPAINDDEPAGSASSEGAMGATDDSTPAHGDIEADQQDESGSAGGVARQSGSEKQAVDEQHRSELQQAGDAAEMDDHPTNRLSPVDAEGVEDVSGPKGAVKRIVLSEEMQVEDTPDLLAYTEQQEEEQQQADGTGDRGVDVVEQEVVSSGTSDVSADAATGPLAPVHEAAAVDMDRLVKKVSRDITAKLEDKLPGIVAKAVRKHLEAQWKQDNTRAD